MTRRIVVVPHNKHWVDLYAAEAPQIKRALGENALTIHHIGSTAVPGLMAKPTIDIMVEVNHIDKVDACQTAMEKIGYQAKGEYGIPGRRYFPKCQGEVHLFHCHVYQTGHPDLTRLLNFRDYLRTHPKAASQYQTLKLALAAQFTWESKKYTAGKTELIAELDQLAAAWRGETACPPQGGYK